MNEAVERPDDPLVIGWREYVCLPDWGIVHVKAKADTGARSCAIDVAELEELPGDRVRFHVITRRKEPQRAHRVEAAIVRRTLVRTSLGRTTSRLFVATRIRLGPVEKTVELGLVCRQRMLCRMLLGRTALSGDFVVDASRRYLWGRARSPAGSDT